jgi:hypothetical protein
LSAELARVKARYIALQEKACRQGALDARAEFQVPVGVALVGGRAKAAFGLWPGEREWDWEELVRQLRGPKTMHFAIWHEEDLAAVGLVTVAAGSVTLRYVEGGLDPCPLTGIRVPIALQVAACYAQGCNRRRLRIEPIRPTLIEKCQSEWGFAPDPSGKGFFCKDVF